MYLERLGIMYLLLYEASESMLYMYHRSSGPSIPAGGLVADNIMMEADGWADRYGADAALQYCTHRQALPTWAPR